MNLIQTLTRQNLITPPKWLPENVHYLTLTDAEVLVNLIKQTIAEAGD